MTLRGFPACSRDGNATLGEVAELHADTGGNEDGDRNTHDHSISYRCVSQVVTPKYYSGLYRDEEKAIFSVGYSKGVELR